MNQFIQFISHHPFLFIALVVIIILLIIEEKKGSIKGMSKVSAQDAVKLINHQNAKIVDVRTDAEFKAGHIVEALNIPDTELATNTKRLTKYKEKPLLLVCQTGTGVPKAGLTLKQQGFTQLYFLAGGINAWTNAGLPLTTKEEKK